jgi:two-component system response regulator FixJ
MREPVVHVIDDSAALRESFEALLESHGINAHSYASAEEFWRNAAPLPIDCLIIDIDLPGASGVDLLDQLRRNNVNAPALFITGRRVSEDVRSAAARLRAAFFEKPILPEELISTVREALG